MPFTENGGENRCGAIYQSLLLPKRPEEYISKQGIFSGWLDQEPFYRVSTDKISAYEMNYLTLRATQVRGALQTFFWVNLGFCPNRLDPPPLPERWDTNNSKKNFDVYFAF